ncbi:FAD-binding oxidoreductase [Sinorhizobium meliloti]|uniref:FAD-binding oxidoreductase n=1 Tax=Rhizobium meliloti TaxID=382 RepID=UPI00028616A8|nr:FAD-binding oxidoreductase [Sinorhizobium meliloti]ASP80663.1 FAD-binding oxidoreductase [Sinorhizobium meliloti]MQW21720.1 FAD-binding protein [Sinorhizobium meliloti]CCM71229.1 D-lactate dehydrogenase [Sinorhizobium meliloti Rm41]
MTSAGTIEDAKGPAELRLALRQMLGEDIVLSETEELLRFCRDWHGDVTSGTVAVIRPRSTQQVAAAVKACRELGLSIVPQGGNTGLVLGAIPDAPERQVVLSLSRMNRIRKIDPADFSAVVESGCILSELKDAIAKMGMFFPLALGAQGSCQIGGNVSTNAGGVNVLRYGMTRELVLGLEVVLPDGSILEGLSTLRKDNRGIDLKQLFIGAEGTLGIITAVSVKLTPYPDHVATALLGLASLEDAIKLYRRARRDCCDLMSAFEFMPPLAFTLAQEAMPDLPIPISAEYPAYVLMEISGSGLVDIDDLMQRFLEGVMEEGLVLDGTIAASQTQARNLWLIREGMNEGQAKRGTHMRTDISVPLSQLACFVEEAEKAVSETLPGAVSVSYGHVGDGNVHLNVLPPAGTTPEERNQLIYRAKTVVNEVLDRYTGSISAEHGIGRLKRPDFDARLSESRRKLLTALKHAVDPEMIMNPGCQLRF